MILYLSKPIKKFESGAHHHRYSGLTIHAAPVHHATDGQYPAPKQTSAPSARSLAVEAVLLAAVAR